ncbi:MAG: hypothetical protein AAGI48_15850 [Verrucomicrobiota bacterium]
MRPGIVMIAMLPWFATLAAQDGRESVPMLDVDAVLPPDEVVPTELEPEAEDPAMKRSERSVSSSGQFGVRGGEGAQRGSLALEAEGIRARFNRLLGLEGPKVTVPIEIFLHGSPGDPARKRPLAYQLRFTKDEFVLEIHLDLARGIDHDRMERAVISGLLYQRGLLETQPGPLDSPLLVPVWLVEGLREAEKWRAGRGDRKIYEGVFRQEGMFSTDEILDMREAGYERLDGASRVAFRALSGALVMALLEQPRGVDAFRNFCSEVAGHDGEMPILMRQHFPELNLSEQSLAKWWELTLAKLADAPLTEVLGIAETEKLLLEALVIRYRDERGLMRNEPVERWRGILLDEESDRFAAIRPAQDSLNRLSYRCFPSYRPLLLEYQHAMLDWADFRKLDDLDETLRELAENRELMASRARRARDYMDFMEIAGATELSGNFDDYIRLIDELKERPRPQREDPVSNYLDTLDKAYQKPPRRR